MAPTSPLAPASFPQMNMVGLTPEKSGLTIEAAPTLEKALTKRAVGAVFCRRSMSDSLPLVKKLITPFTGGASAIGLVVSMIVLFARFSIPESLSAEDTFESTHMVYPYGVHVAVVRVDADTGNVAIERYAIAYDIGKAVNPKLVEGQIAGGLAQGLGGALLEEFRYDQNGEPLSVTFADYLMPTAREVPEVSIIVSEDAPSPLNPLGLKGAGEGGANPVGAVIASAIDDALQRPGAVTHLPVTPQRLKAVM